MVLKAEAAPALVYPAPQSPPSSQAWRAPNSRQAHAASQLSKLSAESIAESSVQSAPAIDMQLHVKNVPAHCDLAKLLLEFRPFGRIIETSASTFIVVDKNTKASKGRAFVHFESLDSADAAISELHKSRCLDAHSCPLEVEYKRGETQRLRLPADAGATDFENKLFVGNLPKDYTELQVQHMFESYGPLREVRSCRRSPQCLQTKGAAFVKLQSKEQALRAIFDFTARPVTLAKRKVEVRYAESRRHPKVAAPLATQDVTVPWPIHFSNGYPGGTPDVAAQNYFTDSRAHPGDLQIHGGWTQHWTPHGKAYYYHNHTRQCQWNPPPEFYIHPPAGLTNRAPAIPARGLTAGLSNAVPVSLQGSPVIVVSKLPISWCEKDLSTHFAQLGMIEEVQIANNSVGQSRCFGYIRFSNSVSASNAEVAMSGHIVGEKRLRVRQVELEAMERLWPPPDA